MAIKIEKLLSKKKKKEGEEGNLAVMNMSFNVSLRIFFSFH